MLDSGFCGKTFGHQILRPAQESHGPQSRMRYHTPVALASDPARLNHEMLVVSAVHHFCPLRLIQVEVGRLPPTILPSTQSSKWNSGGRDCVDEFKLQGSCFTGPVCTMTRPSLEAQGSSCDGNLAPRLSGFKSLSWLFVCTCHLCQQQGSVTKPSVPLSRSQTAVVQTVSADVDTASSSRTKLYVESSNPAHPSIDTPLSGRYQ
jgi:hypothetical protein